MRIKIPIYQPALTGNEKKYVNDCLDSSWISSKGKYVSEFENKFAEYINVNYATTVSNGTVAIHLALLALGIGEGDEVIVPTFTYIASVNAIAYTGAKVVFVDSLRETWQMDPKDIQAKITDKTKAVMAVHLYGHPCEMDEIVSICKTHNIFLVEDCAEAFGSYYKGKHVGNFGHISTFSFFGNKTITTGEGGMVVTNDETIISRAVHLKGQGLAKHRQYWHDIIGYNYRMTNICAAIGLAQLEQADLFLEKKKNLVKLYKSNLNIPQVTFHEEIGDVVNSYWMISILVDKSEDRDKIREHLAMEGIETRPLFFPVHTMPMYSKKFQQFENAEFLGWRGINLPSYPDLSLTQIIEITNSIKNYYAKH